MIFNAFIYNFKTETYFSYWAPDQRFSWSLLEIHERLNKPTNSEIFNKSFQHSTDHNSLINFRQWITACQFSLQSKIFIQFESDPILFYTKLCTEIQKFLPLSSLSLISIPISRISFWKLIIRGVDKNL